MKKPVLLIFTNALILIVIFVLLAQSLFVVQRIAQAGEIKGQVSIQKGGQGSFTPLAAGGLVSVGDVVKTGKASEVEFTWADKTRWRLLPESTLSVQRALVDSLKHTEVSKFHLNAGKVLVRVPKNLATNSTFQVETPNAIASVRGTVFSVAVEGPKTYVDVFQGSVAVGVPNAQQDSQQLGSAIPAGHEAIAESNKVSNRPAPSLADFDSHPSLTKPNLEAGVIPTQGNFAVLQGVAEAGDTVSVNGQRVTVLGNGTFIKRLPLKSGHNQWNIEAIDNHLVKSTTCRAAEYDATQNKTTPSACH